MSAEAKRKGFGSTEASGQGLEEFKAQEDKKHGKACLRERDSVGLSFLIRTATFLKAPPLERERERRRAEGP